MSRLLQTSSVSSLIHASLSSKTHTLVSIHILCNLLIKMAASSVYWPHFACHLLAHILFAMCINSLNLQQKKLSGVKMAWKWPLTHLHSVESCQFKCQSGFWMQLPKTIFVFHIAISYYCQFSMTSAFCISFTYWNLAENSNHES